MIDKQKKPLPNGQWPKGSSGNPAGRPRGSRNKATLALEALLEGDAEQLLNKAVSMALNGDVAAMRLCLERLVPPRKERLIQLDLPPIQTAQDVSNAMEMIFSAMGDGQITPGEGETMVNMLTARTNVLRAEEFEERLKKVERIVSTEPEDSSTAAIASERRSEPTAESRIEHRPESEHSLHPAA
jgi:Family of unknown function (DUF5681)